MHEISKILSKYMVLKIHSKSAPCVFTLRPSSHVIALIYGWNPHQWLSDFASKNVVLPAKSGAHRPTHVDVVLSINSSCSVGAQPKSEVLDTYFMGTFTLKICPYHADFAAALWQILYCTTLVYGLGVVLQLSSILVGNSHILLVSYISYKVWCKL